MVKRDLKNSEFQQVCVVEASAGSGKTYCLAKRYVQLLIDPKFSFSQMPFENVLAITFSNKATLEMKERILEFLKKIALDKFSNPGERKDILSSLGVSQEMAQKRAHLIMDILLKNYNFFQVQTIDSFINAILSGCAYQLGLSANFKIKRDYREDLAYSLDALIDRAPHDKKILGIFHKFLMQYIHIEKKTGWLPKEDINMIMDRLFQMSHSYGEPFFCNDLEGKDIFAMKRAILEKTRLLRDHLPQGTHAGFEKALLKFLSADSDTFAIGDISDFFGREEFPITKNGQLTARIEQIWKQIRDDLRELCEAESSFIFNSYIDIFYECLKELRALSAKEDILFLQELNSRAKVLFEEGAITVAELYYRMAARVRHFLIDEFQDTSRLQWNNLFLLIEEALSCGGSLFYVGDKKQAIYRFRGGDAGLFDAVRADFGAFHVALTVLNNNYRSRRNIVDFCNEIFSENNLRRFLRDCVDLEKKTAFLGNLAQDNIVNIFKGGAQNHVPGLVGGYVRVELVDCGNKDERNSRIKNLFFDLMDNLKTRFGYGDIAVIARENDKVELLTQWLLERGIPVESEKTLNIRNNPYVKEIISFLKFLDSPIDNLAFASFILGDIFAKATGIDTREFHDFVFYANQELNQRRKSYLYRLFRLKFPRIWEEFVEEFFKNVGFIPVYELTVSIFSKFRCLENFFQYQGFFMKLLEVIKDEERVHFGLAHFLDFFDRADQEGLYVRVAEMDSVKVLTIHKAKGLEFGAVVVPFLEMNVKVDGPVGSLRDGRIVLRRISEKHRMLSPFLEEVSSGEYYKCFVDELNNIYVALTRAKNELYCFVPKTARRGVNLAGLLMPSQRIEKGERRDYKEQAALRAYAPVSNFSVSRHQDWIHYLKEEFVDIEVLKNRDKLFRGDMIHSILAGIGNCSHREWQDVLKDSLDKIHRLFSGLDCLPEFERVIAGLLQDKRFRPFFFCDEARVYQEKEIMAASGRLKRIDRLIVGIERVWVIDYKSSRDFLGRDQEQIKEYMDIIASMYPIKSVSGVLIYLDDLSMEEVYG